MNEGEVSVDLETFGKGLLLNSFNFIVTTMILAWLLGMGKEWVIFLLFFSSLRTFYGGYHAETARTCLIISLVMETFVLLILKYQLLCFLPTALLHFSILISTGFIMYSSPIQAVNKPLSPEVFRSCRRVSYLLVLIFLGLYGAADLALGAKNLAHIIWLAVNLTAILGFVGMRKYRAFQYKQA